MNQSITTPESHFGFQLGSDRKMARWDTIVDYLHSLAGQSDRLQVVDMGPSTEGHPFLFAVVSSPENLANLDHLRELNDRIKDPRGASEEAIRQCASEGKAIILQSMGLHASEIGSTQMVSELIYDLVSRTDEETTRILDNVIALFVPCFNPDGQMMVTDWYNEQLGTEYEGSGLPWLYHTYAGHDNNRDAFAFNLVESSYVAKIMYKEWQPHAYQDHHEMGCYGARLWLCPYSEPLHPNGDPLVWREISWYGAHMAYRLEETGKTGVLNASVFPAWSHLGFHWMGNYHNIASMLTESAHAKLATPMYIHHSQLKGQDDNKHWRDVGGNTIRGFPQYKAQTTFPHPWSGGWWHLRDIVEQQKVSAWGLLDQAARHKDTILWNAYLKAMRQTERGASGETAGYLISALQHDTGTAQKMIDLLTVQGFDIHRASDAFDVDDRTYPAGTHWIPLAQPKMGVVQTLLGRTLYPDDAWTRQPDGTPARPYDTTTDTMAEFMGVQVDPVASPIETTFVQITGPANRSGQVIGTSDSGYAFDARRNDSYIALNRLIAQGHQVSRVRASLTLGDVTLPNGAFAAPAGSETVLRELASDLGLDFYALATSDPFEELTRNRIGMYQRYWGGNMDEGWTRLALEQFEFPYQTLRDEEIRTGNLRDEIDVLILPDDATNMITGKESKKRLKENPVPPEYRSGIGKKGVKAIKAFVEDGGMLVTLNRASDFAIEELDLPITNVLSGKSSKEFYCPGSTLKIRIDTTHPLTLGMPSTALGLCWNSPAFAIDPSFSNDNYEEIVRFPERDILQSGWLVGEEQIAGKSAMVSASHGEGRIILYGFRPQHRAQMHGTYKLFFNALIGSG
jgi:hypothetical protein